MRYAGDQAGQVFIKAGTAASDEGTLFVATPSILGGPIGVGGVCVVSLNNHGTRWGRGASVQATYISDLLRIDWSNGSVPLTADSAYNISYICN
jgi:hypothetical protein